MVSALGQTVVTNLAPNEPPGERPYEMVWAQRVEPGPPTVRFDQLAGWRLRCEAGAEASLAVSRAQNLWDRPVARFRYHGSGQANPTPRVFLVPPQPVALPDNADAVDLWVYGNRWDWVNPPDTPPVRVTLHLRDGDGQAHAVQVDRIRWQEWWLMHRRLPAAKPPVRLETLELSGGWQREWRELFLDSIRCYQEPLGPLRFAPRPRRNLTLFPGQSAGANTGPGTLPFPTRERTILPAQRAGRFEDHTRASQGAFEFDYQGHDGRIHYRFDPSRGLGGLSATFQGQPVGTLLDGARVRTSEGPTPVPLAGEPALRDGVVSARYDDGTTLRLRLWQKSLVVDVLNPTGRATELSFGQLTGLREPRTIRVPYLTYGGGPHPCVVLSWAGAHPVFTSLWLDWYRSNGSEPYAVESATTNAAHINGGVRYHPRTDGRRNPLFERLFLTVSPRFEEVLPTVPNPVGLHAHAAADRLWQESWGPDDFDKQMRRSERLRAYGIEKLIQCNHEIAWRDGGESFTLRLHAAPKKGGDSALARYVAHQRGLGWLAGLYSNYTDYAPVNEFWSPDGVQRASDGQWRSAWPRCWAEKPLRAVEFDARLAPQLEARYRPNSAYTDVHTAVAPWNYTDYDTRVPGAGTFAQTFYAYGELLRHDSQSYGGPIFSEGTYQWLYAGLADGNYALAYDGRPPATEPLLPVFDLEQIHPKECDIGMGWTAQFCDAIPGWRTPEHLDQAIDRFLLHTLAYGHIGWLVEEEHGLARTCRSYYMLQQVQARYGLQAPTRLAYWDGARLHNVSEALVLDLPRTRRQLYLEYPSGLRLWLNDHPTENWPVPVPAALAGSFGEEAPPQRGVGAASRRTAAQRLLTLPPAGWLAYDRAAGLFSFSGLDHSHRVDYLRSPAYTYLDGRGQWFATPEAACDGAMALRPLTDHRLQITRISGTGAFLLLRPYGARGYLASCTVVDVDNHPLKPPASVDTGNATRVGPVDNGLRYVLAFRPRP